MDSRNIDIYEQVFYNIHTNIRGRRLRYAYKDR